MFIESLTPRPELENSQGHSATCGSVRAMSVLAPMADRRVYEYTPFCNGPDEVKSPSDRHAAERTLLSVVGAEAATLCCYVAQVRIPGIFRISQTEGYANVDHVQDD